MNNENLKYSCLGMPGCSHGLVERCDCKCHDRTSEQVCSHREDIICLQCGAESHPEPVIKIEPLPEPYSDDHFRKAVVNKINELIKIINKN